MMLHFSFALPATRTFVLFTLSFRCRFFPTSLTRLVSCSFVSCDPSIRAVSYTCIKLHGLVFLLHWCYKMILLHFSFPSVYVTNKRDDTMHHCLAPFSILNSFVCSPFCPMIALWLRDCSGATKCLGKPIYSISRNVSKVWLRHTELNALE